LFSGKKKLRVFFEAVEATDENEFSIACDKLPQTEKLIKLKARELAEHWALFAIHALGIKSFFVRTNNLAECQNSALKKERSGPPY